MSRLKADFVLMLVALIWGVAFVAQKDALDHIGPLTFTASRFLLSAIVVAPLAWRERRVMGAAPVKFPKEVWLMCLLFAAGVILQQTGIGSTSVANAGFITGLYVVFVPVMARLFFRQKLSKWIMPAAALSIAGLWLLSGAASALSMGLGRGDFLMLLCAIAFAGQVTMAGHLSARLKAPLQLSLMQYVFVTLVALPGALLWEHPDLVSLKAAGLEILYAGAISGGIAYTLQMVAQQYTPSSDSAVILSAESVFGAIAAAILRSEKIVGARAIGCGLIGLAILLVEFGPLVRRGKKAA